MKQKRGASHFAQYERPVTPSDWSSDGRRFAEQLSAVLDDIYRRYGRLRMEDMNADTRALIGSLAAKGEVYSIAEAVGLLAQQLSAMQAKADALQAKSDTLQAKADELQAKSDSLETRIAQYTAADVLAKLTTIRADVLRSLGTVNLGAGKPEILSGANLNDYKTAGDYMTNWAPYIANSPTGYSFRLTVSYMLGSHDNYLQQMVTAYNGPIYIRHYIDSVWSSWERIATSPAT